VEAIHVQVTQSVDIAANDAQTLDRASVLDRDVRLACKVIRKAWIYLAGDLYEVKENQHWELLGCDSFEAWLADPEIDLHPRHAYRMVQVWRELVVDRGVPPEALETVEVTKASVVLPAIRAGKATAEDALADAAALSRSDLQERYSGDLSAPLDAEQGAEFCSCPTCGKTHKAKR
jgi:hypothetical protein